VISLITAALADIPGQMAKPRLLGSLCYPAQEDVLSLNWPFIYAKSRHLAESSR